MTYEEIREQFDISQTRSAPFKLRHLCKKYENE